MNEYITLTVASVLLILCRYGSVIYLVRLTLRTKRAKSVIVGGIGLRVTVDMQPPHEQHSAKRHERRSKRLRDHKRPARTSADTPNKPQEGKAIGI
jgi:hypothetical protein